jgi:DNA-directed RNA polymerase subunit K/omega
VVGATLDARDMLPFVNPVLRQRADPWAYRHTDGHYHFTASVPEHDLLTRAGTRVRLVVLSEAQARQLWTIHWRGRRRVMQCDANLYVDGESLHVHHDELSRATLRWWPREASLPASVELRRAGAGPVSIRQTRSAGAPREVKLGSHGVAEAPTEADFAPAAEWEIDVPASLAGDPDVLLRIEYDGDVARLRQGGALLNDHFHHDRPCDTSLREVAAGTMSLRILPRSPGAPILWASADAGGHVSVTTATWRTVGRARLS